MMKKLFFAGALHKNAGAVSGWPCNLCTLLLFWSALWFCLNPKAYAQFNGEGAWSGDERVQVRLLSSVSEVNGEFWLGVHFNLKKDWHIYWKNPGDSGLPTEFKWDVEGDSKIIELLWPKPSKFILEPLVNFGYSGDFIIPVKALSGKDGFSTRLNIAWLACKLECIPGETSIAIKVPGARKSKEVESLSIAFANALKNLPISHEPIVGIDDRSTWRLDFQGFTFNGSPSFFPDRPDQVANDLPSQWDGRWLTLPKSKKALKENLSSLTGLIISGESEPAFAVKVNFKLASNDFLQNLILLFFAFLGGIILNLMPCVFPVLAIKALGIVQTKNQSSLERVSKAFFYMLGIIVSFWLLAGVLLVLRQAGAQLGWGFQLQSPLFVACLALLLFGFALNLLGVFELSGKFMGWGQDLATHEGKLGDFFSGFLTVLVSTPCSAPFMAGALGAAILQPGILSVLLFTSMGLGLGMPYCLIILNPAIHSIMPKPGQWMVSLREFLAFPLFLTVVWLVWIYCKIRGIDSVLEICGLGISFYFAIWSLKQDRVKARFLLRLVAGIIFFASLLKIGSESSSLDKDMWIPFSSERIASDLQSKQKVFIDFTAAWCLSCQVNDKIVLQSSRFLEIVKKQNIKIYKADWTTYDPAITEALRTYGRAGVPLYVYYKSGDKEPIILPQILSVSALEKLFSE